MIFYLSSGQGSMTQTSRFVRPLLEFLFPAASEEILQVYHAFIRKFAHFFFYAVLGFWAWRATRNSSHSFIGNYYGLLSLLIVAAVASIDETNQSFNSARTGSPYDVLLDISGGLTMILLLYAWTKFRERRKNSQTS